MRVLHLLDSLGRGGAEQSVLNLLPEQRKLGYECRVAFQYGSDALQAEIEAMGFQVHAPGKAHHWNLPLAALKLKRVVSEFKPDIVQSYVYFSQITAALARPLIRPGRHFVSLQSLEYERETGAGGIWPPLRRALRGSTLKSGVDAWVGSSTAVKEHYETHLGIGSVKVIPNAVPALAFQAALEPPKRELLAAYGIKPEDKALVLPGRLIPEKAHHDAIEAARILKSRGLPIKVLFFGKGPLRDEIQRLVRDAGLESEIRLIDPIPQPELFRAIRACDVFMLPSLSEGFGLAVAEAMTIGTPVVATSVGGIVDFVENGKNGLLVPPRSPEALAAAIESLLADPSRARTLADQARLDARHQFGVEGVARQWDALYRESLSRSARASG